MQAHAYSSAEAAEPFDLPLAAVLEAVDYYQRHEDLVDADTAEERRRRRAAWLSAHQGFCFFLVHAMIVPEIRCQAAGVCNEVAASTRSYESGAEL